jgi:hypothetical protein
VGLSKTSVVIGSYKPKGDMGEKQVVIHSFENLVDGILLLSKEFSFYGAKGSVLFVSLNTGIFYGSVFYMKGTL